MPDDMKANDGEILVTIAEVQALVDSVLDAYDYGYDGLHRGITDLAARKSIEALRDGR